MNIQTRYDTFLIKLFSTDIRIWRLPVRAIEQYGRRMLKIHSRLFDKMNHAVRCGVRPHFIGNVGSPLDESLGSTNHVLNKRGKVVIVRTKPNDPNDSSCILMSDMADYGRGKYILHDDYEVYLFKAFMYWSLSPQENTWNKKRIQVFEDFQDQV
jgi:hypothetical protein